jgi:hypothetical protein
VNLTGAHVTGMGAAALSNAGVIGTLTNSGRIAGGAGVGDGLTLPGLKGFNGAAAVSNSGTIGSSKNFGSMVGGADAGRARAAAATSAAPASPTPIQSPHWPICWQVDQPMV